MTSGTAKLPRIGHSIRATLFGLVGAPILALIGFMAYDTYHQYTVDIQQAYRTADTIRALTAAQAEHTIAEAKFILSQLAKRPSILALDAKHCDPTLAELKQLHPDYANVIVLNAQGELVCSATAITSSTNKGPDPKYYFNELRRTHQFTVGKPAKGFVTGRWVSSLAYPLEHADGTLLGALSISVDLAKYQPVVNKKDLPALAIAGIINEEGGLIARSDGPENRIGLRSNAPAVKVILEQQSGFVRSRDYLGAKRFYAFSPIANTTWIAFVSLDEAAVFTPFIHLALARLAIAVAVLLLVLTIALRILKSVAKPVEAISQTIGKVASGNTTARVTPDGPSEIQHFGVQLNTMLDAREEDDAKLQQSEQRYRALTEWTAESLLVHDGKWILYANPATIKLLGAHSLEELISKPLFDYIHPDCHHIARERIASGNMPLMEQQYRTLDGRTIYVEIQSTPMLFDGKKCIQSALHDITARKIAEEQNIRLAFYNAFTNLPNRRLLIDRLQVVLASNLRKSHFGALLYIDMDNFKTLNDTLGHAAGDQLILEIGQRLERNMRAEDTVAHLGADDFIILINDLGTSLDQVIFEAKNRGEQILEAIRTECLIGDVPYRGTASIGITVFGQSGDTVEELLKQVDLAMYQAKDAGHNTLRFFDTNMQAEIMKQSALENGLREALARHQFHLYFQAQMEGAGRLIGAEALVRWQHPTLGLIGPGEFIQAAEKTGLIIPLGNWVLEAACRQLKIWDHHPHYAGITLSVNISAHQLRQDNFTQQVIEAIHQTGVNPNLLKLELTESVLLVDIQDTISKMTALRSHGVRFSLDDFGTGYSSLTYLRQLPMDQLKIDQSFIAELPENGNACSIVRTISALGKSLGMVVSAEGVETEAQRQFLNDNGCHFYQGYLFSKPLPIDEFTDFVDQAVAKLG